MILSNFCFLRFAQKGHFQAVNFFLTFFLTDRQTDRPTNLVLEAPFRSLKSANFEILKFSGGQNLRYDIHKSLLQNIFLPLNQNFHVNIHNPVSFSKKLEK